MQDKTLIVPKQWAADLIDLPPSGRDDVTRTRDPYVPNVVRYQLRYISI